MRILAFFLSAASIWAQRPAAGPVIVSPEVHADKRVTFRLLAPQATQVMLRAESMQPAKMEKDEKGVWSFTIGPVRPDMYSYSFSVDGVTVADPRNSLIKEAVRGGPASLFDVPGEGVAFHARQDVPHGAVHEHWYSSKAVGKTRRFHVYTPPGYDMDPRATYPVLYLLHGSGDTDREWTTVGRANWIIDNLIAQKKATAMIVVMPDGHPVDPNSADPAARGQNTPLFERDLVEDVMPMAERIYRIRREASSRALAGLSMGGGQTLAVGTKHSDKFAHLGVFSMGINERNSNAALMDQLKNQALNKNLQLFWIGCGKEDGLVEGARKLSETLKANGVKHVYRETDGAHVWWLWRTYLAELAPQLFRKTS
ncbi:MAG: esterase family protein [Candidatus Solibacter usitatus]|nr:esterase family protein [Candidatus Solibacter usitatus]